MCNKQGKIKELFKMHYIQRYPGCCSTDFVNLYNYHSESCLTLTHWLYLLLIFAISYFCNLYDLSCLITWNEMCKLGCALYIVMVICAINFWDSIDVFIPITCFTAYYRKYVSSSDDPTLPKCRSGIILMDLFSIQRQSNPANIYLEKSHEIQM